MTGVIERKGRVHPEEFAVGTRAIVSTGRFRCLAVFEEDGQWHEMYGSGKALVVSEVLDPILAGQS